MIPFLKQVAEHYYGTVGLGQRCFIFPNRRSMVFFRKYLSESIAADSDAGPMLMPAMFTINDFFYKSAGMVPTDRVRLLLCLYECYCRLNPRAEPLDEFVFWGDVILGDFNDVDKYLVDPGQLFTNVADLKKIQDTYSYLSEAQRKAIEGFVSHFSDVSGRLTVDLRSDNPDIKERFLQIWNILYPLYREFNDRLASEKRAYEGMVYRELAGRLASSSVQDVFKGMFPEDTVFVFIGLNTLNECEKTLLRKLKDASRAEFCWDYSGDMIRDTQNRSSLFMDGNVKEFGQVREWDPEGLSVPVIHVLSVPSSVGQAKRIPEILAGVPEGEDCAIVLPDENILVPVLNSIPPEITDVNVTMGLPMKGSLVFTMMETVASIQLHMLSRKGRWHFYHKQVWDLFSNELFRNAADEKTLETMNEIKRNAKYYIPQEDFSGTALLEMVFRPVVTDPKKHGKDQIVAMAAYFKEVLAAIASKAAGDTRLALELEYAREYYRGINMLPEMDVLPLTYIHLLRQLLGGSSVPFRGEPLKGLQIMGPLETRALDFDNLIIMSANEGVFPRRNVSSSFIPPELRKGFGLPTYELQDAIWAYYFYRMISRAGNVWMLVDSRTEGLKSGEESRYIKQLEYHFGIPLDRCVVSFDSMKTMELPQLEKTEEDVEIIRNTVLSATALQNYLSCPASFCYSVVRGLKAEEEVADTLDYGMFGTIFHEVMRSLYTSPEAMSEDFCFDRSGENERHLKERMSRITGKYIREWLSRESDIRRKVRSLIVRLLSAVEVSGRNLVVTDVIVKYVMKTLARDLELMEAAGVDSFEIYGREKELRCTFHGFRFKGVIDRLDSFDGKGMRVVDYKTGKVLDDDVDIHDGNAESIADSIFAPDVKERPKIALQFFIYDMLLKERGVTCGRDVYNCVYSTSRLFKEVPESVPMNASFYGFMSERLESLLDEMCDVTVGFRRTEDRSVCEYCDFRNICGR